MPRAIAEAGETFLKVTVAQVMTRNRQDGIISIKFAAHTALDFLGTGTEGKSTRPPSSKLLSILNQT
jgi:hypothetical protein